MKQKTMNKKALLRTVEATLAGIILITILVTLFSARPAPEIDALPIYDLLASLDQTNQLRQDAASYNSEGVWASLTTHLPKSYRCHVEIIGDRESGFGPTPISNSATASYFLASPAPREVRVTVW